MDYDDYDYVLNRTDRVPALFVIAHPIDKPHAEWIIEHQLGRFEVDAMFRLITFVLSFIPLEPDHLYIQYRTYRKIVGSASACFAPPAPYHHPGSQ